MKKITVVSAKARWFLQTPEDSWFGIQYLQNILHSHKSRVPFIPRHRALAHKFITLQGCVVILRNTYVSDTGKVRLNRPEVLKEAWKNRHCYPRDIQEWNGQRMSLQGAVTARAKILGLSEVSWRKKHRDKDVSTCSFRPNIKFNLFVSIW